jgi:hypothetical protein
MIDKFTAILLLSAASVVEAQEPFQVISKISATTIAGRPVQLDADGKLLPWPMPDDTGYSYSSHFLTQWSILWDQYNRDRDDHVQVVVRLSARAEHIRCDAALCGGPYIETVAELTRAP